MPAATLAALRQALPAAKPYPDVRPDRSVPLHLPAAGSGRSPPDSMGKAIPNAEIMVLREDGSPCAPNEPGELVHRGVHVSLGYWNDPAKTAERFKVIRARQSGLVMPEVAVWSGDTVRMDEDGYLYFISRRDEMIKTSGYRVSPTEVEEVIYASDRVGECAAFGVSHPQLGQSHRSGRQRQGWRRKSTRRRFSPAAKAIAIVHGAAPIELRSGSLPRNPNGKIDRKLLAGELAHIFGKPE